MKATFGQTLRAYRLGFRPGPLGYWVRIGSHGDNFLVDICPPGCMPKASGGEYYVWWERGDYTPIIALIYKAIPPGPLTEQITFTLNDAGEVVP